MTVGDRDGNRKADYDQQLAQKLDNDVGKIIHLTQEGTPAPDNPFLNKPGVRPEIWAYGIRSPEGFAFASDGTLWETEHGPRGGDELNRIQRGKNYGWPIITHGIDYPGGPIGEGLTAKAGPGAAGLLLGPGDRALGPCGLSRQALSQVERQSPGRRIARDGRLST